MDYGENELESLFRALARMHINCVNGEFHKNELGIASHPPILLALKHSGPDMTTAQKELASILGISPSTVAISVKRMEKAGLLEKASVETDLRRNMVTLTPKGLQMANQCEYILELTNFRMLQDFSDEERRQLTSYFLRMISNLENMGVQPPAHLKGNCCKRHHAVKLMLYDE